jgi:hypothetical protein
MALAFMLVITLVLVVLGLVGYIRDPRRGLLALIGTLVGVILVDFWAAQWGPGLASRFVGGDVPKLTFIVSCGLFLWCALFVGYGGGLLLSRAKERPPFAQRLAGALLGVLNGVLIVGFLLRFASVNQSSFGETIQSSNLSKLFHDGLPLLFLGLAVAVTLLVIVRGVGAFVAQRSAARAPKPADTKPDATPATSSSAPTQRINDREVLNKVNDASRR